MKLEFADAAAAEVTEQLKKGVNGDKLHLDLGTTHLRDVSLGWILAAWEHCSGMTSGIKKGYENAGTLQAFDLGYQRQLSKEVDAGSLFADMGSELLDSLTNDMYAEAFDGVSSMLDDDPAINIWEMETILLRKPRIEDGSILPAMVSGMDEDLEA